MSMVMGVYVANFMDHGSSKTPAGLVSNTTGLGSTQTTLLGYHMQEWIRHMHYMQDAVSTRGRTTRAVSFHNSLGWVHPWPRCRRVSPSMHPECNLSLPMHRQIANTLYRIRCRG